MGSALGKYEAHLAPRGKSKRSETYVRVLSLPLVCIYTHTYMRSFCRVLHEFHIVTPAAERRLRVRESRQIAATRETIYKYVYYIYVCTYLAPIERCWVCAVIYAGVMRGRFYVFTGNNRDASLCLLLKVCASSQWCLFRQGIRFAPWTTQTEVETATCFVNRFR